MRVEHPRHRPPASVDVNGASVPVDDDGTFGVPDDARPWLERFAAAYDTDPADLLVGERCDEIKSDDEVCGRELPCPYHTDEDEAE